MDPITGGLISGVMGLVDDLFTSDDERAAAKLKVLALAQEGKLKEMETSMSAIISESKSEDPWTSRARPSFLYIIYVMILISIPMGILSAFQPEIAARIATGMQLWLGAVPESLWALFGAGYLGYTTSREYGKHSMNKFGDK